MVQALMWVSVRCDQCAEAPHAPGAPACYRDETAALDAAMAAGWRVARDGRLWCPVCAPILTCETHGHQFTDWRRVAPAPGAPPRTCRCGPHASVHLLGSADCRRRFRFCRRCCVHESGTTTTPTVVA